MTTDIEYAAFDEPIHPLCVKMRNLRRAAGISLQAFEAKTGIPGVVVGSYERGDRIPPLSKLEAIFAAFGYQLVAVPIGTAAVREAPDMVADLHAIADQLAQKLAKENETGN